MTKAVILVSVLLLGWTGSLQGIFVDGDKVESTVESTSAPAEVTDSTANATVAPTDVEDSDNVTLPTETPFNATEVCNEAPETGPCKAAFQHYFYNSTSNSCELFIYGGCGGNQNNFEDAGECMKACHTEDVCHEAPETGRCLAYMPRYFYNSTSNICEVFIYGGCGGNQNNFKEETECMQRCHTEEDYIMFSKLIFASEIEF